MIAPPFGDTGGPEIVTQNLVDALIEKGVDVTLFAPGDWKIKTKHIPTLKQSLWNMKGFDIQTNRVRNNYNITSQLKVLDYNNFDIFHFHSSTYAYAIGLYSKVPCVLTLHNCISKPDFEQIRSTGTQLVTISKSQKGSLKSVATIWNGLPLEKIESSLEKGKYLVTVGRIIDQKGIDTAIKIAKGAKKQLIIIGRLGISKERINYFEKKIKPHIDGKNVIFKPFVKHERIYTYLKNAEALVFPIRRPESLPLAGMEALACGTPIIGTKIDPLPEEFHDKKVAFLSNDIKQLIRAAKDTTIFDRSACRKYAEKYFDSSIMANKYINLYKKIIKLNNKSKKK